MQSTLARLRGNALPALAVQSGTKAGWKVREWSRDVGCSPSRTWELIAEKRIDSVKLGASRIIITPPAVFLAGLVEPA